MCLVGGNMALNNILLGLAVVLSSYHHLEFRVTKDVYLLIF